MALAHSTNKGHIRVNDHANFVGQVGPLFPFSENKQYASAYFFFTFPQLFCHFFNST
jgi:hypothetical protein